MSGGKTVTANRTDHRFTAGTYVEYGTRGQRGGDRLGEVCKEANQWGQDGYLIRPVSRGPGDGYLPEVYPGRMVYPADMSQWQRKTTGDGGYVRKPAEPVRPSDERG